MGQIITPMPVSRSLIIAAPSGTYRASGGAAGSSAAAVANSLYFCPIFLEKTVSISALVFHLDTGETGKTARCGIYSNNAGVPDSLIVDAGTASLTGSGGKEIATSQTLPAGWYWGALVSDTAGSAFFRVDGSRELWGAPSFNASNGGYYGAHNFGALPSSAPSLTLATSIPSVFLKVA